MSLSWQPSETGSQPAGGFLGSLRTVALTTVAVGALGSLGLLFHASQNPPPFLMAIFVIWLLAPFLGLLGIQAVSKRRPILSRASCYWLMMVLALASLAVYSYDAVHPRKAQPAFVYVVVPLASWLLIFSVIAMGFLLSRMRSRRRPATGR